MDSDGSQCSHSVKVKNLLPQKWYYEVYDSTYIKEKKLTKIRLMVQAETVEEVKEWVRDYEEMHKLTYAVRSSEKGKGRKLVYKVRLCCQHNTGCERLYSNIARNKTKNTKCPSAMWITLHAERVKNNYQGKNELLLNSDLRCEICLIPDHNHYTECPDALKFRRVSQETVTELRELYKNGHTPSSAIEVIKSNIQLNSENPDILLADRAICPDYTFCYRLYTKEYGPLKKAKDYKQARIRKPVPKLKTGKNSNDTTEEHDDKYSFFPSLVSSEHAEHVPIEVDKHETGKVIKLPLKNTSVEGNRSTIIESPIIESRTPVIEYKIPPINNKPTIIGNRATIIENGAPIIETRTPIIENRTPVIENRASIIENRTTTIIENNPQIVENRMTFPENRATIVENSLIQNKEPIIENRTAYFPADLDIPSVTFLHITDDNDDDNEEDEITIEIVKEAEALIQQMNDHIRQLLGKSPGEVRDGLKVMVSNLNKINSVPAFISSCSAFGIETTSASPRQKIKLQGQDGCEERPPKVIRLDENICT